MIPLLISVLALGTAILLYLKKLRRAIPRVLSLSLLLLLALGAAFRFDIRKKTGPPVVVIDASQSMARYLTDVRRLAADLRFKHQTVYLRGHDLLRESDPVETLGTFTDLTAGLLKAAALKPSCVILISDGNHNFGPDPRTAADDWNFPVYTVGCGAESLKDQTVADVYYPAYVFRDDSTVVEAVIESRGFTRPEPGRVILESADKKIALTKTFTLSGAPARVKLAFPLVIRTAGPVSFRLSIPAQGGELDVANNYYDFRLDVRPDKIKVLYYTDHLSFNTRFLVPILKAVPNFELRALVRLSPERLADYFTGAEPQNLGDWRSFDVWVLDDVDFRGLREKNLTGFVNQNKGILFIGGIENLTEAGRAALPIPILGRLPTGSYPLSVTDPFSVLSPAGKYPPLSAVNRVIGTNPGSVTIARSDGLPVIAYRNYGTGTIFQINALDIGVWQFNQSGTENDGLLAALITDIVRFLSTLGKQNRLILKAAPRDCEIGATVNFTLQSYDRDLRPGGGGDFYLSAVGKKIPFFETRPNRYEAEFIPQEKGDCDFTAIGTLKGDSLRSNLIKIKVSPRRVETDKTLDRNFLVTLAEKTGGRYRSLREMPGLAVPSAGYYRETRKFFLDQPVIYVIVFLLLAADWLLRRRRGIL